LTKRRFSATVSPLRHVAIPDAKGIKPLQLQNLTLDFEAIKSRQKSMPEQVSSVLQGDLPGLAQELYDRLDALSTGVTVEQVTFVALDPAQDSEPGWNLAHIILHITATAEEGMALGSTLARGVEVTGRSRHEPDWETVTTAEQVAQRLAESRRMVFAFLDTWPDAPYLENTYQHNFFGPMNAISHATLGLYHGQSMLPQVEEIVRQATAT
jgi:hypothetical protein